jgi:hypothetical protein
MTDARRAAEAMREAAAKVVPKDIALLEEDEDAYRCGYLDGISQMKDAILALPLPDATPQANGVREIAISVLSNCAMQYVDGNSQRSIDRAIDLAVSILTAARDAEIARLSAELEAARGVLEWIADPALGGTHIVFRVEAQNRARAALANLATKGV